MTPKFFYFDLGKVLVDFSVEQMCRQMSDVSGVAPARVQDAVFGTGLQLDYESGRLSSRAFYEAFCRQTGSRPDYAALLHAGSDIFTLNVPMIPVVAQLSQAGHRLGILSNTCEGHWEHCLKRYSILRECFSLHVLSYEVQACKPRAEIFCHAAKLAGYRPEEIFYTDDIAGHVEGARSVGIDAVLYTTTPRLATELRSRGVLFNY